MKELTLRNTLRSSFTIGFSVLTGLFAFIPAEYGINVFQNWAALMAGCVMGGIQGAASSGLFLIAGTAGLRIFPGLSSGKDFFYGPFGGYLWGYFLGALCAGLILRNPEVREKKAGYSLYIKTAAAYLISLAVSYVPGILWEINTGDLTANELFSFHVRMVPTEIAKLAATLLLVPSVRPVTAELLYPEGKKAEKEAEELIEKFRKRNQKKNRRKNK